jgi:hypothetical protein
MFPAPPWVSTVQNVLTGGAMSVASFSALEGIKIICRYDCEREEREENVYNPLLRCFCSFFLTAQLTVVSFF